MALPAEHVDPATARDAARSIVGSRRFQPEKVPRPFEGVLNWIGDRLKPIGHLLGPVGRLLGRVWDFLTHGLGSILGIAVLVGVVVCIALALAQRRGRAESTGAPRSKSVEESLDPTRLERDAANAEAAGDYDRAVRLRFRAGLLRLDRAGVLTFRPSLTSGQAARVVRVDELDELAITFDRVVYGGTHAERTDADAARAQWPRVIETARSR
jgi:hypothetical protein